MLGAGLTLSPRAAGRVWTGPVRCVRKWHGVVKRGSFGKVRNGLVSHGAVGSDTAVEAVMVLMGAEGCGINR